MHLLLELVVDAGHSIDERLVCFSVGLEAPVGVASEMITGELDVCEENRSEIDTCLPSCVAPASD